MNDKEFLEESKAFLPKNTNKKLLPLIREKISYFGEIEDLLSDELSFVNPILNYAKESLMWKQEEDINNTKVNLNLVLLQ